MTRPQVRRAAVALLVAAGCDLAAAIALHGAARQVPSPLDAGRIEAGQRQAAEDLLVHDRNCYRRSAAREPDPEAPQPHWDTPLTRWPNETERMRVLEKTEWKKLAPVLYIKRKPKLAVLMFATLKINNDQVWINWLERAKKDGLEVNLMIHAASIQDIREFQSQRMVRYINPNSVEVSWCNMWMAQIMLMRKALKDLAVSHVMVVSRDSIPVKPLSFIYQKLEEDPSTRMCADDGWRGVGGTPRAESWWLMRREDAEFFVDNSLFARKQFVTYGEGCVDEQAWYYPLKMREEALNMHMVKDECVMFTDWADGRYACKDWRSIVDGCGERCDQLRDSPRTEADGAHPVNFKSVNRSALQGLIDSPFWFARKFGASALQPEAAELLN